MYAQNKWQSKQQKQTLVPLGEIDYMDYMTSFDTIKNQGFINIVKLQVSLDEFF